MHDEPTLPASAAPVSEPELPDRYEDLGRLGLGGMAEVRRVRDRELGSVLAMKVLAWARVDDPRARARFRAEARLTAQLVHPGIVEVHDLGELPDGRLWYTMTEVRGRTFQEVLDEGQPVRRSLEVVLRVCEAMAYAHSRRIVHRDLKPSNIMVGGFGDVRVMDWGLGRVIPPTPDGPEEQHDLTVEGEALGTPTWMAPEQAFGAPADPTADVWALGALLYRALAGHPPRPGHAGPPTPLPAGTPGPLADLCARALAVRAGERPATAAPVAEALRGWLEGARRRDEARALLSEADRIRPRVAALRAEASALGREADALLREVREHDPVALKRHAWSLQDRADALEVEAAIEETSWLQTVRAALASAPDLDEAHARLAVHYREEVARAEEARRPLEGARAEALLRAHDRGEHAAFVAGIAALDLVTDPPGATVRLYRLERKDRRLEPAFERELGRTPLRGVPVIRGSYLLELVAPGREVVRYPVQLGRGERWDGVPPGASEPAPVWLPPRGVLGDDTRYVPAGWFRCGDDPEAIDPHRSRHAWVEAFLVTVDPITVDRWRDFLDRPLGDGSARRRENRRPEALDLPVTHVSWHAAMDYAAWWSTRTGRTWRLPTGLEWEKAARGVDGRRYPFGDFLDPTWTVLHNSRAEAPRPRPVHELRQDISPYGVRGTAGNVRDWCVDPWTPDGSRVVEGRHEPEPAWPDDLALREVRGGCFVSGPAQCRVASRFAAPPGEGLAAVGLRLVAPIVRAP